MLFSQPFQDRPSSKPSNRQKTPLKALMTLPRAVSDLMLPVLGVAGQHPHKDPSCVYTQQMKILKTFSTWRKPGTISPTLSQLLTMQSNKSYPY